MIQQVNLYQEALKGASIVLPASLMAAVGGGLVVLLLLVYGLFQWQLLGLREEAAALQATVDDKSGEFQRLAGQLQARKKNQTLEQRVARMSDALDIKRRLLKVVSGQAYGNTHGFSAHLSGLGRQQVDGLWLTEISVFGAGNDLVLKGSTLDPQLVPSYLQALAAESAYLGRQFSTFWMARPPISSQRSSSRRLDFVIATRCQREDGEALEGVSCDAGEAS